ncbi:MAG TPA: polysaccharide deacetylase family protein [Jiangellales bacterium]|nr:polysaccharide deacetylase family protein [Jiangellales bacterium]
MRRVRALAALLVMITVLAGGACGAGTGDRPASTPVPPRAPTPEATVPPATATVVPGEPTVTPTPGPGPATPVPEPGEEPVLPSRLAGQDFERIPTTDKIVALTFDAGANADAVPSILATLAAENVRATFFLTGDFVQRFGPASRSIASAGHRLANHSATHPQFTALSDEQISAQIRGAETDIRDVTGQHPQPLFRFPFGDRDARTIAAVNDLGYVAVRWTVDTLGWQGTSGGRSAEEVTERVLDTATAGQIVLMHVGSHPTDGSMLDADALATVIGGLRAAGYRFVTLDALVK